jgi:predicted small lipoprotein YifL
MNKRIWIAALALALAACMQQPPLMQPASAPAAPPVRVRGTVDRLDGNTLVVGTRQGTPAVVTLAPNYVVRTVVRTKLTDIKTGDFLASTAVKGKDGKLHAIEVHIFLPA